ncbi:MAG: rod-binding protein [Candidatus Latescibacterota bacterium]
MNSLPIVATDAQHFMAIKKADDRAIQSLQRKSEIGSLKGKVDGADELREAAKQFEAVFMSQLLKQMRSTVHKEEMFHGGAGEDIFTEMLDEKFAEKMSVRGTGIADMLYRQLSRQFGIGETETDNLPMPTGSGGLLQQKLQDMQQQIQNQEPQPMSVTI